MWLFFLKIIIVVVVIQISVFSRPVEQMSERCRVRADLWCHDKRQRRFDFRFASFDYEVWATDSQTSRDTTKDECIHNRLCTHTRSHINMGVFRCVSVYLLCEHRFDDCYIFDVRNATNSAQANTHSRCNRRAIFVRLFVETIQLHTIYVADMMRGWTRLVEANKLRRCVFVCALFHSLNARKIIFCNA